MVKFMWKKLCRLVFLCRCHLILLLAGDRAVILNCKIFDYTMKNSISDNSIIFNNKIEKINSFVEEEMYTGSPGKKVHRIGNSFVLKRNWR
jgi:hypothetical protein